VKIGAGQNTPSPDFNGGDFNGQKKEKGTGLRERGGKAKERRGKGEPEQ